MQKHQLYVGNLVHVTRQPRITPKSDEGDTDSEDTQTKVQKNGEGDMYVDLGKRKRVTVRSFKGEPLSRLDMLIPHLVKGNTLVDIREYYGTEGDEKPGKKGISLTVEQVGCCPSSPFSG
jgi:activated RNA polymerase II transcriptional coactivator p15